MNIFITGSTSGIGLSLAKKYLDDGHHVAISGRDCSKVPDELKNHPRISLYTFDIKQREDVVSAVDRFVSKVNNLDMMIVNAGRSDGKKRSLPDFDESRDIINVNVMGALHSFEAALKYMIPEKRGHLVAVSSVAGFLGLPGSSSYSASKAALTILCESYRLDLDEFGIDVTTICPGFIDTPLTRRNSHPMPFLMNVDKAADLMIDAIKKKKALFLFPWQMKWLVIFLNKIPRSWYQIIMSMPFAKYNKKKGNP